MDILSFALYHENNDIDDVHQATQGLKRQHQKPTTDSSDAKKLKSDEKDPKRQACATETWSHAVDTSMMDMKRAVYQQVSQSLEDSIVLEDICVEVDDRQMVLQAVQALEEDGKVLLTAGEVYLVD
jgi:hypothetical protein